MSNVERKAWVACILKYGDYFYLLERGAKHHIGMFEFPAGKVDVGETPIQAIQREVEEEAGLVIEAERFKQLATVTLPSLNKAERCEWDNHYYVVEIHDPIESPYPAEPHVHSFGMWTTLDGAKDLKMVETSECILPILSMLFRL